MSSLRHLVASAFGLALTGLGAIARAQEGMPQAQAGATATTGTPADAKAPAEREYEDRIPPRATPCIKCLELSLSPSALAIFSPGNNNLFGGIELAGVYRLAPPDWAVGAVFRGMPASSFLFTADVLGGWTPFISRSIEPHVLAGARLYSGADRMTPGVVTHIGNHLWFTESLGGYVNVDVALLFTKQINPSLGGTLGLALRL